MYADADADGDADAREELDQTVVGPATEAFGGGQ
jgi:hypothetical protein